MTIGMKIAEERKEAREEGRTEGKEIVLKVIEKMSQDGLEDEIVKLSDLSYLQKMISKYGLEN